MALIFDRVKETTTTGGTGDITLGGAQTGGFQPFSAVLTDGQQPYYCIQDTTNNAWETGVGTYHSGPNTLTRTTVLASSNAGALVNFAVGTKDVFITYPAERAVMTDIANTFTVGPQTIQTGNDGNVGLVAKANSSTQTANLIEVRASDNQVQFAASATGFAEILQRTGAPAASKGLFFAGEGAFFSSPTDYTNGLMFVLGYNNGANRQFFLFDSFQAGSPNYYAFRYILGQPIPMIDGVTTDGSSRANITLGYTDTNIGVGFDPFTQGQSAIQGKLHVQATSSQTNNIIPGLYIYGRSTSAPTAGFGVNQLFQLLSSTTAFRNAAEIDVSWANATDATRKARWVDLVYDAAGSRETDRRETDGTQALRSFFGATAVAQQSIGAAATDAASTQTLANNIRTALLNLGLCKT